MEDIGWKEVIRGRILIVGNINAHSPSWNSYYRQRQNASLLEESIKTYNLFINNNIDFLTWPKSWKFLIIDLVLIKLNLDILQV